ADTQVDFDVKADSMTVNLTALNDRPRFIEIRWDFSTEGVVYVLGDAWERSYGDLCFEKLSDKNRPLPWYFAATDKTETDCFGVKTQPNAFVCFLYDRSGITAKIDCRNGGAGVQLGGRKIELCTFVFRHYAMPPFESLCEYCKTLCDNPLLPENRIYGGNNWYYAYGKSSFDDIMRDAALQAELSSGIDNRPFMVVDDGWEINSCQGPNEPNDRFADMRKLADEMEKAGVIPGLWVRLLNNADSGITDDMKILRQGEREYLDPTNEKVKALIRRDIEKIRGWGYKLLKHDFSTVDLFGNYGMDLSDTITNCEGWHFADETKTNAEIVLDFYRLIKEACGDMLILGCNTVSHLCAGLVHINRTGDDTSGREWERTRKMGVNTLAFRLSQNNAFYVVDADCVGILDDNIPWRKNRQWLDLLSRSDTALFISCGKASEEQKKDISKAYREIQKEHIIKPVDIYENLIPSEWEIDGEAIKYNWD
ncbi:MAG: alpha-galactosidase, partial [Clostridia bacterium]|nr:alpha-galactosidase [Clostridia bacterium]